MVMPSVARIGAALVLVLAACTGSAKTTLPEWDFFGVVAAVDLEEPLVAGDGLSRGGPESVFSSGAMTITFVDGSSVEVPHGTPGGNWCRDLAAQGARDEECVLAGKLGDGGRVAWFEVLDVVNTSEKAGGGRHVEVSGIEDGDDHSMTIRGLTFPVHPDATVECSDDASTVAEAVASGLPLMADVSIADGAVFNVWCLYEG